MEAAGIEPAFRVLVGTTSHRPNRSAGSRSRTRQPSRRDSRLELKACLSAWRVAAERGRQIAEFNNQLLLGSPLLECGDARCSSDQPRRRALLRLRDVLGDPVGTDPRASRFRPRCRRSCPRARCADCCPTTRRARSVIASGLGAASSSAAPTRRWRSRGRCSARAPTSPRDGVRVRLDEPRHRARHHPGAAAGLAVHARPSSSAAR